jgi:hypothetical protein
MANYDERHGGPFDRGGADFWYGRGYTPHYYKGGSYTSDRVEKANMTKAEIAAYRAGYKQAEERGDQKDWGDAS